MAKLCARFTLLLTVLRPTDPLFFGKGIQKFLSSVPPSKTTEEDHPIRLSCPSMPIALPVSRVRPPPVMMFDELRAAGGCGVDWQQSLSSAAVGPAAAAAATCQSCCQPKSADRMADEQQQQREHAATLLLRLFCGWGGLAEPSGDALSGEGRGGVTKGANSAFRARERGEKKSS
ncbi:hypothetical protein GPALN_005038 [Globodera pallida]|nr:hypothetical protein GPALN_005038 [Globodera pallida]